MSRVRGRESAGDVLFPGLPVLRDALKLSVSELKDLSGVSISTITNLEHATQGDCLSGTIRRIIEALCCKEEDIRKVPHAKRLARIQADFLHREFKKAEARAAELAS